MEDGYSEKIPLTQSSLDLSASHLSHSSTTTSFTIQGTTSSLAHNHTNVQSYKDFVILSNDILFKIEECQHSMEKLKEDRRVVYDQAINAAKKTRKAHKAIEAQTEKLSGELNYMHRAIATIEPASPKLTDLDYRNQKYKAVLRSYKELLEKYINITLESQRYTSILFEDQIRRVNPHVTNFDLERAVASTGEEGTPSLFVQVLLQRGERKSDKKIQEIMRSVQDIHQDLRILSQTFSTLSEMRNEANILIERYRRRWPVMIKEGTRIYLIDDNLNVLEQTDVGVPIDFDELLRQKEMRNKAMVVILSMILVIFVIAIVASTAIFSM